MENFFLQGITVPKLQEMLIEAAQIGAERALAKINSDPFKGLPDNLKRKHLKQTIDRGTGWICHNAIKFSETKTLGRPIDYSTEIVEYRDENNQPYYKKDEIRQYHNRLISKKSI